MKKAVLVLLVLIAIANLCLAEAAIRLEYNETDLVSLKPRATDLDSDSLVYAYSQPLDADGRWQTKYGDAGEYTIKVTVSDKELSSSQDVTVVINKKEVAPTISSFSPVEERLMVDEGKRLELSIEAEDLNKDQLSYEWSVDGKPIAEGESFVYMPSYNDAGLHKVKNIVSDGELSVSHNWDVDVKEVDRSLLLKQIEDIEIVEGETAALELPDFSEAGLSYTISEPLGQDNYWITGHEDAGVYYVKVTINDDEFEDSRDIKVEVKNKDRPLYFQDIDDAVMQEGQKVVINLDANDPDNDQITFSADGMPEGASLESNVFSWQTNYDTVKKDNLVDIVMDKFNILRKGFVIRFKAKSNDAEIEKAVKITVLDVNRAPVIEFPDNITVNEGEEINIEAKADDPDGDPVTLRYRGFMDSSNYLTSYDDSGEYSAAIIASDGRLEAQKEVKLIIKDANRAPVFGEIPKHDVIEGNEMVIKIEALDPDGDKLVYSGIDIPAGSKVEGDLFIWKPDFDAVSGKEGGKGIAAEFMASDGSSNTTQIANITVYNMNRPPKIANASPSKDVIVFKDNPVLFSPGAVDPDGDELSYEWKFSFYEKVDGGSKHKRTFTTLGNKKVEAIVSDGIEESSYVWNVRVMDYEEYKKSNH